MAAGGSRRSRLPSRIFGGLCLLAGLAVAILAPADTAWRWTLAAGLGVVGGFAVLLLGEPTVSAASTGSAVRGGHASLRWALEGLHVEGSAVYVPGPRPDDPERLFVPAAASGKPRPAVEPGRVVYADDPDEQGGVAIPPPGLALLDEYEEELGARLRGGTVPEAEAFLKAMGDASGLYSRAEVTRRGEDLAARFAPAVETPCLEETRRGDGDPSCVRAGCPVCSLVATTLVRVLERPLRVAGIRGRGEDLELVLEAAD